MSENKPSSPQCFSCNHCGYRSATFKAVCPKCGNKEIMALEGTKGGKVVDFVPIFFPPENLKRIGQYVSVLVKLDNGCQIFGIVLGDPHHVKIGTPVVVSSYDEGTKELYFNLLKSCIF